MKLIIPGCPTVPRFDVITFPGGEPHVTVDPKQVKHQLVILEVDAAAVSTVFVSALCAIDALCRAGASWITVLMPYFPGARQDREMPGNALTVEVYANMLKASELDEIVIFDPHSDVTPALLDYCTVVPADFIIKWMPFKYMYDAIIVPDAGAEKRAYACAKALGINRMVFGRKHRDVRTGALSGFELSPIDVPGKYLVVDDICDGGGTFLGLADKFWKQTSISTLDLYVTHGIFSKGVRELLRMYHNVYSTDSYCRREADVQYVSCVDIYQEFLNAQA